MASQLLRFVSPVGTSANEFWTLTELGLDQPDPEARHRSTGAQPVFDNVNGVSLDVRPTHLGRNSAPSTTRTSTEDAEGSNGAIAEDEPWEAQEFKLPDLPSLLVVVLGNVLAQISFFIIVSSASAYAEHLGGSATFSGLAIGIPPAFAGLALIPMVRTDKGRYKTSLMISYAAMILGGVLYALAYRANWLYMILIGRVVSGLGFTCFMYSKRYCSDPRLVGIRRRTTLASWLVVGQGVGFSAGPFFGGLLYRIGFPNAVFNGYTSPGWFMAIAWMVFGAAAIVAFKDVAAPPTLPANDNRSSPAPSPQQNHNADSQAELNAQPRSSSPPPVTDVVAPLTWRQWGVVATMMWYAMTCFFVLGAWESNIPVYSAAAFKYSPYNAGNFIALGGITTFPFLILNVWYSQRLQDRMILAAGSALGMLGLVILLVTLYAERVSFGSYYVSWALVALGFNLASTCTLSLLSKQLPGSWNGRISLAIQYSNYTGRVSGAIWGGAGLVVGMTNYVWLQIAITGIGMALHFTQWRDLKAKTG